MVSRLLECEGIEFATLIDPSAIVDKDVSVGKGSIICAGVICTVSVSIGEHTIINLNSTIGHEVTIENYVTVAPNVSISGNVCLKDFVEVGTGATLRERLEVGVGAVVGDVPGQILVLAKRREIHDRVGAILLGIDVRDVLHLGAVVLTVDDPGRPATHALVQVRVSAAHQAEPGGQQGCTCSKWHTSHRELPGRRGGKRAVPAPAPVCGRRCGRVT